MAMTMKSRVRSMMNALRGLLKDKSLPAATRQHLEAVDGDLKKSWATLADEAVPGDPEPPDQNTKQADEAARPPGGWEPSQHSPLQEAASIGAMLEARIHSQFTLMADDLYEDGMITRDERIAASSAIGSALDAFILQIQKAAPALYQRMPGEDPDDDGDEDMGEAIRPPQKKIVDEAPDPEKPGRGQKVVDETDNDPNVGGGVDRDKLPAEDFAGKNRSFPIVKPGDVSDAASSIGRAGSDNYSSDQLKANIIRIARRKGAAFVAQLPKAWREADKKDDDEMSDDNESARPRDGSPVEGGDPISEALEMDGEYMALTEAAGEAPSVRGDGTIPIKIIRPGWGSSGYYPPEVLKRDGPQVFKKGLKLYWNHPTPTEEAERPERDLRDLAAELTTDAQWLPDHPKGAGLYASARVFKPYQEAVDELGPHIGVSIRALGKSDPGMVEGKRGQIIKEISAAKSVDFVTSPGAGGQILQLFEAKRQMIGSDPSGEAADQGEQLMAEKDLQEANAILTEKLARLEEALLLREASEMAATRLLRSSLPDATRERLQTQLVKNAPAKDGQLDREAFDGQITEAIKTETQYLTRIMGAGRVVGMGYAQPEADSAQAVQNSLEESFRDLGLDETLVKLAAKGR